MTAFLDCNSLFQGICESVSIEGTPFLQVFRSTTLPSSPFIKWAAAVWASRLRTRWPMGKENAGSARTCSSQMPALFPQPQACLNILSTTFVAHQLVTHVLSECCTVIFLGVESGWNTSKIAADCVHFYLAAHLDLQKMTENSLVKVAQSHIMLP